MASFLRRINSNSLPKPFSIQSTLRHYHQQHRQPPVKRGTLTIAAIGAVETLKRAQKSNLKNLPSIVSRILYGLSKPDLHASFREILRQDDSGVLSLEVFSAVRWELKLGLSVWADVVSALDRSGRWDDIDRLICDLEESGGIDCEDKGLIKLIKALMSADRRESTVKIYDLMKCSGWGNDMNVDDYLVRVLRKGLRKMGEVGLSDEVDFAHGIVREFGIFYKGSLGKLKV